MTALFPVLLVLLFPSLPAWGETKEERLLAQGEEILKLEPVPESRVKQGIVQGVIEAPFDRVWNVITDYEHYTEFMPRTEKIEVRERDDRHVVYFSKLNMPWPIEDVAYDCEVNFGEGHRSLDFQMVPGTGKGVKRFHGNWKLEPFQGAADRILVTYTLLFEPTRGYAPWLFDLGTKHSLSKVIGAVRDRVRERRQ